MNKTLIATLAATALLAGCATPGYQPYGYYGGGPQYAPAPQYPAQVAQYPQYSGPPAPQYPAQVAQYPQYSGPPAPPAPAPTVVAASGAPCYPTDVIAGQIIGGIAGALLGAQVGKGNGRTAAAAVGAATGALAGGHLATCR